MPNWSNWRHLARPIIAKVIAEHGSKSFLTLRKKLREAYPWGERAMHPYKIWCSECSDQMLATCLPPEFPARELQSETGRIVIADYWDEHGDPQRAAFVRSRKLSAHERQFGAVERQRIDRLYQEAMSRQEATR